MGEYLKTRPFGEMRHGSFWNLVLQAINTFHAATYTYYYLGPSLKIPSSSDDAPLGASSSRLPMSRCSDRANESSRGLLPHIAGCSGLGRPTWLGTTWGKPGQHESKVTAEMDLWWGVIPEIMRFALRPQRRSALWYRHEAILMSKGPELAQMMMVSEQAEEQKL